MARLWFLLLLLLPLLAQPSIQERIIYVPLEDWDNVSKIEPKGIRLSYAQYLDLLKKQPVAAEIAPLELVIHDVLYKAHVSNKTLHIEMNVLFTALKDTPTELVLELGNLGVEKAFLDNEEARIRVVELPSIAQAQPPITDNPPIPAEIEYSQQQMQQQMPIQVVQRVNPPIAPMPNPKIQYYLWVQGQGRHTAKLMAHYRLSTSRDELHGKLILGNFAAQCFELETQPELEYTTNPIAQKTENKLAIYFGNTNELNLMIRPKEQQDVKKTLLLTTITSSHVIRMDSVISWFNIALDVRHGPQKTCTLVLPENLEIVSISENRWEASVQNQEKILTIQFDEAILGKRQIVLKCEQSLIQDGDFVLPKLKVKDDHLFRQEGWIKISKTEDVDLELLQNFQVRQLAAQECESKAIEWPNLGDQTFAFFKFGPDDYQIVLKKKNIVPKIESSLITALSLYRDGLWLASDVKFDILQGKVKELMLQLPPGWVLTYIHVSCNFAANRPLQQIFPAYHIKNDILVIPLENKLTKGTQARVVMKFQQLPEGWQSNWESKDFSVPLITPLQTEYMPSFLAIIVDPDYQTEVLSLVQASSVDLNIIRSLEITSNDLRLGMKLYNANAQINLKIKPKTPYNSVMAMHYIAIEPERIRAAAVLVYEAKDLSRSIFHFVLPKEFPYLLHISDEFNLIKEKSHELTDLGHEWKVTLQKKVLGSYSLYLSYEVPLTNLAAVSKAEADRLSKTWSFLLPNLQFPGVDRKRGFIGITTISQAKIQITSQEGLSLVPLQQFPIISHPEFPLTPFLHTYKFANNEFKLTLNITMYEKVPVATAILTSVKISTIYPQPDLERVLCEYRLNHLGRQYFEIKMPPNANFWSAVVNEEGEKPLQKDGQLSIPIPRHNDGRPDVIYVAYERPVQALGRLGKVYLECPKTAKDIPIQQYSWSVYLPAEYKVTSHWTDVNVEPWYETLLKVISQTFVSSVSEKYARAPRADSYAQPSVAPSQAQEQVAYDKKGDKSEVAPGGRAVAREKRKFSPKPQAARQPQVQLPPSKPRPSMPAKRPLTGKDQMPESKALSEEYDEAKPEAPIVQPEFAPPAPPEPPSPAEPILEEQLAKEEEEKELSPSDAIGYEDDFSDVTTSTTEGKKEPEPQPMPIEPPKPEPAVSPAKTTGQVQIDQTGITAVKVAGIRSLDIEMMDSRASVQVSRIFHGLENGQITDSIRYMHEDMLRSLRLLLLGLSTIGGLMLLATRRLPRFPMILVLLLVVSFIPFLFGKICMQYCNFIAWGILLSIPLRWIYLLLAYLGRVLRMARPLPVAMIFVVVALGFGAQIGLEAQPAPTQIPTIYVPYNPEKPLDLNEAANVFVSYERYRELWNRAYPKEAIGVLPTGPDVAYYLYHARYVAEIQGDQMILRSQFLIEVKKPSVVIPLGLAGTAVKRAMLYPKDAEPIPNIALTPNAAGSYTILLRDPGQYRIELDVLPPGKVNAKRGDITLSLASIPTSLFEIQLDEDLEVNFGDWPGDWYEHVEQGRKVLSIFPGQYPNLSFQWYQSSEQSKARGLNIAVTTKSTLTVADQLLQIESNLQYNMISGKSDKLILEMPSDFTITQLQCTNLERWILAEEKGVNKIILRLLDSSQSQIAVQLRAEKILPNLPAQVMFPEIIPLDATRENGELIVSTHNAYSSLITESSNLRKMGSNQQNEYFWELFHFNDHPYELSLSIQHQKAHNVGETRLIMKIGEEKILATYSCNMEIRGKDLFGQEILVPNDYKVAKVTGPLLKDWRTTTNSSGTTLALTWASRLQRGDNVAWQMELEKELGDDEKIFAIPYFASSQLQYQSGDILIASSQDIMLSLQETKGLQEYDVADYAAIPQYIKRYAFKFEGSDYSGKIQRELKGAELELDTLVVLLVEDDWIHFGYYLRYKIAHAATDTFQFRLPENIAENLEILGDNIKEIKKEKQKKSYLWQVVLHTKVRDQYLLTIFPRVLENKGTGILFYPMIFPSEIRQRCYVVIQNQSQYELLPQNTNGLSVISPTQVGFLPPETTAYDYILAYKMDRRDWQLTFTESKQQVVASTRASIDDVKVDTTISKYGECRQRVIYNVRHSGLQFLELERLQDVNIWGVFVGGQFIRPVQQQDRILIPLQYGQSQDKENKISVRIIYSFSADLFKSPKRCNLKLPLVTNIDEIARVHWTVYLPKGYFYKFGGNISPLVYSRSFYFEEYQPGPAVAYKEEQAKAQQQQILSSVLSSDNRLKLRQERWQKDQAAAQERLFSNMQDVRQQADQAQNAYNVQQLQQYGVRNLVDAQRAGRRATPSRRDAQPNKIAEEARKEIWAGETNEKFSERQSAQYAHSLQIQQAKATEGVPYFQFDVVYPSDAQVFHFAGKQGNTNLEINAFVEPEESKAWRMIQLLLLLGLIYWSYRRDLFSFAEGSFFVKLGLIVLVIIAAILILVGLPIVVYFY